MKRNLIKQNYPLSEREFIANQFIVGNGRIGYKGTLEEDRATHRVTFNVVGVYDQKDDLWRESLNLFNPLYLKITNSATNLSYTVEKTLNHTLDLDLSTAVLTRTIEYEEFTLNTKRFIHKRDNIIGSKVIITATKDVTLSIKSGIDSVVYEINGPHYKEVKLGFLDGMLHASGVTNEGHIVDVVLNETSNIKPECVIENTGLFVFEYEISLKAGEQIIINKLAEVFIDEQVKPSVNALKFDSVLREHEALFAKRFNESAVVIKAEDKDTEFHLNYAIYHLLILENEKYQTSIPARGLSGQVYKGAIFWDTEVFMLPFYLLTNPKFARNLINYRINTLNGAKHKAKRFGYTGAFYAWESQEDGIERCSLYNVTDAITNEPLRTYFADKQIHISAAVLYGLNMYIDYTGDTNILNEGGLEVFTEVFKFYHSYATKINDKYHFLDVVGPDEYHERVDDNAFTNYHIKFTLQNVLNKITANAKTYDALKQIADIDLLNNFIANIYLPLPNENGIIEQFKGYFELEDINVATLKARIRDPKAYLGGEHGIATPTRVIKQADVITLLALYPDQFSTEIIKQNFEFYEQYTEHGSSLSSSMYGLTSARLGFDKQALSYLNKSAATDLSTNQKLFAGGIYIGGTHPASSGGAYKILMYGLLGAKIIDEELVFFPNLPSSVHAIKVTYTFRGKQYTKEFNHDSSNNI